jgi:ATP-dependent Clp protease ATP-binding subunit ClpA
MFERFSNRARAVLVNAQEEARMLQHNFIGTEHLLLGVIAANDDLVVHALSSYDFTLEDVREKVAETIGPGDEPLSGPPPFTPRAKKVLELSLREAISMGDDHIGVPHILLAIMREGEGVGAQILVLLGVDYERTRMWIGQQVGLRPGRARRGRRGRMRAFEAAPAWPSATLPVQRIRAWADTQVGELGTHDLLLALLNEKQSMAAQALEALEVSRERLEAKIAEIGLENTSDAPPKPPPGPKTVQLAEGVEVRISDPELSQLVESGDLESLLREVIRRAQPES